MSSITALNNSSFVPPSCPIHPPILVSSVLCYYPFFVGSFSSPQSYIRRQPERPLVHIILVHVCLLLATSVRSLPAIPWRRVCPIVANTSPFLVGSLGSSCMRGLPRSMFQNTSPSSHFSHSLPRPRYMCSSPLSKGFLLSPFHSGSLLSNCCLTFSLPSATYTSLPTSPLTVLTIC